jgi:formylglycine-generating enzyme
VSADIRDFIIEHFSREGLMTLCADYFQDFYAEHEGSTAEKSVLARKLIDYCSHRSASDNLRAALQQTRPEAYTQRFGRVTLAAVTVRPRDRRRVFLSHAHEDARFAQRLAGDLRGKGFDVWIAPDNIQPGENWMRAIGRGLRESGTYVVVLTPQSVMSQYVRQETEYALQQHNTGNGRLIPIVLTECDKDELSPLLHTLQHISFEIDYDIGLASLLKSLEDPTVPQQPTFLTDLPSSSQPMPSIPNSPSVRGSGPGSSVTRRAVLLGGGIAATVGTLAWAAIRALSEDQAGPLLSLTLISGISMDYVRVSAGLFVMGSDGTKDAKADANEMPQHKVVLPEYYIGKSPVTNAQFGAFVNATGVAINFDRRESHKDHPVVNVTWHDRIEFCKWLSKVSGRKITLPSEAEWEKAARGKDGRIYPWGNDAPTNRQANIDNYVGETTPVGIYSPQGNSVSDCVDMAGNVWQWTRSLYRKYPYVDTQARENLLVSDDNDRVLRGGSWASFAWNARCACRVSNRPLFRSDLVGFRCVVESPSSPSP